MWEFVTSIAWISDKGRLLCLIKWQYHLQWDAWKWYNRKCFFFSFLLNVTFYRTFFVAGWHAQFHRTSIPDKQRPCVHFVYIRVNVEISFGVISVRQRWGFQIPVDVYVKNILDFPKPLHQASTFRLMLWTISDIYFCVTESFLSNFFLSNDVLVIFCYMFVEMSLCVN